jgi:hypothetical protein
MRTEDSTADVETLPPGPAPAFDAYDPERGIVPTRESFIRLRAQERVEDAYGADPVYGEPATIRAVTPAIRESLANDQLNFTVDLLHLQRLLEGEVPFRSAHVTAAAIRDRLGELEDVRDAIEALLALRDGRLQPLLGSGSPLAAYLKGLYLFSNGIVEAFEDLLTEPPGSRVEWTALRWRIAEAAHFHFDGLIYAVRCELQRLKNAEHLVATIEELFFAATYLHEQVQRTFR